MKTIFVILLLGVVGLGYYHIFMCLWRWFRYRYVAEGRRVCRFCGSEQVLHEMEFNAIWEQGRRGNNPKCGCNVDLGSGGL